MKHFLLCIICIMYSFVLYADTPTNTEPVTTEKRAIVLQLKPSRTDIHRAPSLNTTTLYGYYDDEVLYIDVLDMVDETAECTITTSDFQIVTTAIDLYQGVFIGDVSTCSIEIEIEIDSFGVLVGVID